MLSKINSRHENISILIVEDSPTQAEVLKDLLTEQGYLFQVAENGKIGLEKLKSFRPDIIISDIMMPEMDGFEFCKIVKDNEMLKEIPVIFLTTLSDPEDIVKALEAGADSFITKPYNKEFLFSRLNYILINLDLRKNGDLNNGVEYFFNGKKHLFTSEKVQIIDLLLSSYEVAVRKNEEVEHVTRELQKAFSEIKKLKKFIPICAGCKKVRKENNDWQNIESYIKELSDLDFSHSLCPDCVERLYPELRKNK